MYPCITCRWRPAAHGYSGLAVTRKRRYLCNARYYADRLTFHPRKGRWSRWARDDAARLTGARWPAAPAAGTAVAYSLALVPGRHKAGRCLPGLREAFWNTSANFSSRCPVFPSHDEKQSEKKICQICRFKLCSRASLCWLLVSDSRLLCEGRHVSLFPPSADLSSARDLLDVCSTT